MKKNERLIQYFDIGITGKTLSRKIQHKLKAPRDLNSLMAEFQELQELRKNHKPVSERSKQEYRLEDMEEHEDFWVLLINVVDTNAAHIVTKKVNGEDKDRAILEINKTTGLESSSHLIIFKEKNAAKKHLCLFDRNGIITFNKAVMFLNFLCRTSSDHNKDKYTYPHPSGATGQNYKAYCFIDYLGHPSDLFKQELTDGKINDLRLTSDMDIVKGYESQMDGDLIGTDIKMSTKRIDVIRSGGNWKHLQKALKHADTLDAPFVKVSFVDKTGASHSAEINTDTGMLENADRYIRKSKVVGFGDALRTAFPFIHSGIRDKMLELLK